MSEVFSQAKALAVERDFPSLAIDGPHSLIAVRSLPQVREPSVVLNDHDKNILTLVAQGLSTQEMSDHLGIPGSHVQLMLRNIKNGLGVATSLGAVMAALEQGQLDLSSLVSPDFDPSIFENFTRFEKKTLSVFVANGDSVSDRQLAFAMGTTVEVFGEQMDRLVEKAGAKNRTQLAVLFYHARNRKQEEARSQGMNGCAVSAFESSASKDNILSPAEIEVISLKAQGLSNKEVGEKRGSSEQTIKNHMAGAMRKLNAPTGANAIFEAIELGILDLQSLVPSDFDPAIFKGLWQKCRELIMIFTDSGGKADNKELSLRLGISEHTLKNYITKIMDKTGIRKREQLLVFYLEAKRRAQEGAISRGEDPEQIDVFGPFIDEREEKRKKQRSELSPREIEALGLVAKGYSRKEVAVQMDIPESTLVNNILTSMRKKLQVTNSAYGVAKAIEQGQLNLADLVPENFDPYSFGDLTDLEAKILLRFVETNGAESDEKLADVLGISKDTVVRSMKDILYQLGAKNRAQGLVFILRSRQMGFILELDGDVPESSETETRNLSRSRSSVNRRAEIKRTQDSSETEVITLLARGFNASEIAERMRLPISVINYAIARGRNRFEVSGSTALVVNAIKAGELDSSSLVPVNYDFGRIGNLTGTETLFLEALIKAESAKDKEIADKLLVTEARVREYMKAIIEKTGARNRTHAVVLYMEAKRRAEGAKDQREIELHPVSIKPLYPDSGSVTVYVSEDVA
ncbi:MAG: hypothetical protein HYV38_00325 [Candidatus Levybacteria bacterium]|nr:hypothetical protein [Candidatus Levybacteria bacterium]